MDIRADERDAGFRQSLGERGVLGQEPVARMNGLGTGVLAGLQDPVDDKIALGRWRRADVDGFVRHRDVQCIAIRVRIDGHGLDAHSAGRLDHAASNLATIRDQYFVEHFLFIPLAATEEYFRASATDSPVSWFATWTMIGRYVCGSFAA